MIIGSVVAGDTLWYYFLFISVSCKMTEPKVHNKNLKNPFISKISIRICSIDKKRIPHPEGQSSSRQ